MILFWFSFVRTEKSLLTSFKHIRGLLRNALFGPSVLDVLREIDPDKSTLVLPF